MSEPTPGRPWTDDEIRVVIHAYKRMLDMQESGEDFVKAEIRHSIQQDLPARSSKAIDLKWCNISAVLAERNRPWVDGFTPLPHLQQRLREIVEEEILAPATTTDAVAARMRNTPRKDTPFEIAVKMLARERRLDFQEDESIPGVSRSRPDLLFPERRLVVYLDGCYWHWCPEHFTLPTHNREWWLEKLIANVQRDRRHVREFAEAGWVVLRFWEHESPEVVVSRIAGTLQQIADTRPSLQSKASTTEEDVSAT